MFYPKGTLDYKTAQKYNVTVECTTTANEKSRQFVDIILIPNTPPRFDPSQLARAQVPNAKSTAAGTAVYRVRVLDAENDTITFSSFMSDPKTDNFEIGADGVIRAKNALASECNSYITFKVNISDGHNDPVGPLSVGVTLNNPNTAPVITNRDTALVVLEDQAVGTSIMTIAVSDDDTNFDYTLSANPPANLAFFEIDQTSGELRVKSALDYENSPTRGTNLTIVVSDSNCASQAHSVYVTIDDVNEPPDIYPKNAAYSVYEGFDISHLTIPWSIQDEDLSFDTHTYSIIAGNNNNWFRIDPSTGQLSVTIDYDIDNGAMLTSQTLTVAVTDKGSLVNTTDVTLLFKDANDNAPVISPGVYDYTVCDTATATSFNPNLGTMICTDEDTSFERNNETYFSSSGSGVTVQEDGRIVLLTRPPLFQTYIVTAYCKDRGVFPSGPLQSTGRTVTVYTTQCTTTTTTVAPTIPTTTTTTTTPAPTTTTVATTPPPSTDNVANWADENLWWIAIAALLGTALLGLLMYMWVVHCWKYCGQCWQRQWCQRRAPQPRRLKEPIRVRTPVRRLMPREKPTRPSPPPTPPPAIVGDPNARVHGFWKERYPDDDYTHLPDRTVNPRPVTP
eukprot:GHVL01018134.1.p1 GENE.GHVL01018134.1~~GHVL01018134.1.p1  ORF type:complete len:620 (+),score=39.80 GHVL01018134.1:269-2128(+)